MEDAILLIKQVVESIPKTAYGVERQMLIGDLISRLSQEERITLRSLLESYLLRMFDMAASDIDLGGYGSGGKIW